MTTKHRDNLNIQRPDWLTPDHWPYETKTIHIQGTPIAYVDEGSGPTILLVSDGLWSYVWGQLIDLLRSGFRVLTLDFPGSGLSPDSGDAPSVAADADLLGQFVTALGLDNVTLVGHDIGGVVGLSFAIRHPQLVSGLVLMNTFAWLPDRIGLRAMIRLMSSRSVASFNAATNLLYRFGSGPAGIGRHLDADARKVFVGPYREKAKRYRFHRLMGSLRNEAAFLSDLEASLPTLATKPVLTIYGERNDPFGFQARFKEIFPDAAEMVIERGNHFPMCDDPAGVADRIGEFAR